LTHIPGGNIAMAYFRPQLPPELEFDTDTSGFSSAEILRRTFARRLAITPGQYRASFGQAKIQ
jgi:hypothetical protein